jgi:DNA helicase-2/ATP-dependent DNA helicase PcrA
MEYLNNLEDVESQEQFRYLKMFYDHIRDIESIIPDARVLDIVTILQQEIDSGDAGSLPIDTEAGPEMVKIMTMHAAKGLEFKYVFVTNLVDRRFPTIERKEAIQIPDELVKEVLPEGEVHIQEERRLFYVAMTRAKQGLFLTSAENYGGVQKKKVSRFLNELEEVHNNFKISTDVLGTDAKSMLNQSQLQIKKEYNLYIPKRFSFTQLKIFDECPFAYKMQFLLGVPLPGKFVFSYGTTMHSTLQQFMQLISGKQRSVQTDLFGTAKQASDSNQATGLSIKLDELLEMYEKNWLDDWYDSKEQMEEYKKKGKQALKVFYENLQKHTIPNVKALERGFNIKIEDNTITGKMDRVDAVGDGEIEIVDYKTGNPPKNDKLTVPDKRQLLIYQIGAEEVFRENVKNLTYYYVDSAKPIEFLGTDEEKQEVKLWITETIDAIHQSDFAPKPQQHFCDYCEFFSDVS